MAFAMISCFVYKINWGVRRNLDSLAFSWEQRKLGEVLSILKDGTHGTHQDAEEGPYLLSAKNIKNGQIIIDDSSDRKISEDEFNQIHTKFTLENGDILLTIVGSIGESAILENAGKFTFQRSVAFLRPSEEMTSRFLKTEIESVQFQKELNDRKSQSAQPGVYLGDLSKIPIYITSKEEQKKIGGYFQQLDHLITLHQRKHYLILEDIMLNNINKMDLFYDYYAQWITVYKEGAIRKVTMDKYLLTQSWIKQLAPELRVCELSRITYQKLLNDYAKSHERQTTMDFHHQLKGAVLDAVDEGLIERDPTRKAIIKGKKPRHKKIKYLNQFELHKLLSNLDLGQEINWDWFILLVAKTGMRFSEALAITPKDFDFSKQSLSINKTWDYKGEGGFMPTKNQSSIRKIQIDWQLIIQFSTLVKDLPEDEPIFVSGKVYNSTVNDILERHCKKAEIPVISIHGLRHTHASLLLFAGVSIASVAQRLGHSSMTTTQKTYLHIIQELENKDVDLVMRSLSSLN